MWGQFGNADEGDDNDKGSHPIAPRILDHVECLYGRFTDTAAELGLGAFNKIGLSWIANGLLRALPNKSHL
jgi:hypothetical protein